VLAAAVRAVSDPSAYHRLLSRSPPAPPLGREGEEKGKGSSRVEGVVVEGYDSEGFCLAGQTCNKAEYVYLSIL